MSARDREKWDARYTTPASDLEPSPIASLAWLGAVPAPMSGAVALDLACGLGRNTFPLAQHGYHVVAADISAVGLRHLRRRRRLHEALSIVQVDVDEWPFAPSSFDLVVQVNFLDRRVLAQLLASVKPNGLFLLDTFAGAPTGESSGPRCSDHRLESGELRRIFARWDVLRIDESAAPESRAAVLARRSAEAAR